MSKAKKKEEIEEVVAEVIPSGDEGGKVTKKKPGRPKKVDGLILAENPHYFISQPNDVTQAISNLSAVERNGDSVKVTAKNKKGEEVTYESDYEILETLLERKIANHQP